MRAIVAVLLFAIPVTAWFAAQTVRRWWHERQVEQGVWDVREISNGQGMVVELWREGQKPQCVGTAWFRDVDYSQRLEDLRSEAHERLVANNSKRKRPNY